MSPNQDQQEQERQQQRHWQQKVALWEAAHRVNVTAEVTFPGGQSARQQFQLEEDRDIESRTTHFLDEAIQGDGPSADRFAAIKTINTVDGHDHPGGKLCQIAMLSCSSEALIMEKDDPFMYKQFINDDESLVASNTSNTYNNTNVEVRVE